ncbi:MAG: 2-oxoacid:acceptor oxidoreductase family protein [Deltaproteobacteria bacterium]|nr:2-oxoacid:acceptor oxidoreductase family protein [Deltaproteobacteria bacterium]MBW1922354.1 2-oxoacid:acceptor oxidoreductase family protein [Deltaproteobacteria bacterium]MBW1948106.1 2-oxoacid:acceptor oxidoreductase family protein [Deltaproteobacteria bacterium]MBW2006531.1 2-oxoacid:acceptor oxidoreductase family protein [Deltaproteobacteria bacterium]MBW2101263.1 2-oxoacid:acceptor oxidoreductase family protein [Deltaproteobacteria bacterium]
MTETEKGKAEKTEIIITGFGGQGIILAGRILGKAATLGDHRESTLVQSYGPESRGGACSAQVTISDSPIPYPYVRNPDILVCMSQGGYEKFGGLLREEGTLLIDRDLVRMGEDDRPRFAIPATRMAEELGRKMMANIIMLGFLTSVTGVVSPRAARDAVAESVPKGTEEMNITAFNKGFDHGAALLKGRRKKASGKTGA